MENRILSNGVAIPEIGFGTYKSVAGEDKEVIKNAVLQGYRHLDSAAFYNNEVILGESVRESGIKREEMFITTKIWKDDLGIDRARMSFNQSLERLGMDYVDLLLIHWPKADLASDDWRRLDRETWKVMEDLYKEKRVRAIGVSNFLPHHLMNLIETADIMPMVNQIEFHPGYAQTAVVEFCKKHQIQVEAWSPISRGRIFEEPLLMELAEKYNKSIAQVCLKFALQSGVIPLPKASSRERMNENKDIYDFTIEEEDIYRIITLPQIGWSGEHPDRERV